MHKTLILILTLGCSAFAEVLPPSPEDILKQERPASWPEWVDVEMDASILTDESLKKKFAECFSQAPSLMLDLSDEALSWRVFDDGFHTGDANAVAESTLEMTRHEQQVIIVPTWNELGEITLESGDVTHVYTVLAENVMKPSGDRFTVAVPGGDLADTADRWKWIDDSATGSPNGIIGAWKAAGKAGQRALVRKKLKNDSLRFSQMQVIIDALPLLTRIGIEAEIRVNDHLDKP